MILISNLSLLFSSQISIIKAVDTPLTGLKWVLLMEANMKSLFSEAAALCAAGTPFVWASIIRQDGSTPRSAGSKMIILEDRILSTIGGGGMEGQVIDTARREIMHSGRPMILEYHMSGDANATLGLACGGDCEVLLAPICSEDEAVFSAAAAAEESGTPAWLFYILDERADSSAPFQLCANIGCERLVGKFSGNPKFARDILLNPIRVAIHGDSVDGIRYLVDDVGSAPRMILFGAGHVSCEVAKLAVGIGFHVIVIDDRADYANTIRFPDCDCIVVPSFEELPSLPLDDNSYVVIMTRGHSHDREVLEWALDKPHKYLGMIGSKTKRDGLYRQLNEKGVPMEKLQAVKCPIGLSIYAETPAEIAVSVMAEIILERRRPN